MKYIYYSLTRRVEKKGVKGWWPENFFGDHFPAHKVHILYSSPFLKSTTGLALVAYILEELLFLPKY